MADTGKRVEVRYGAFACTIDGYDDPVERMREVLALVQRMVSETPALADADSGLDDEQFARLDQALADRRAEADERGVIVIRSGHRIAGDAEDAEILADAAQGEGRADRPDRPDRVRSDEAGPQPAAAIFSAPAAAVAEAAFAASMATDEADVHEGPPAQVPLGDEAPDEPATQAALFSAPAAEIADRSFSSDIRPGPQPADDDDAEEAEPVRGDEAAAERAQHVAGAEGSTGSDGAPPSDAWATSSGEWPTAGPADAGGAEPLPRLNIFAPPPPDAPPPAPEDQGAGIFAAPPAEPRSLLRRPTTEAATAAPGHDAGLGEERDEVLDDGAADWDADAYGDGAGHWPPASEPRLRSVAKARGSEGEPSESTENRLAALITRYQTGLNEREAAAAQHADAGGISAADLAERAGAADVADLLAVSAAWLTLAGGRPRFNRREVMEVFETLPGEHQRTLEARIKGFGKLVRSGTLMLVDDGAFAMPPQERERFRELMDQR